MSEADLTKGGTVLPITRWGTPVMHAQTAPVTEFGEGLHALVRDMFATMRAADGVGLAATQVGVGLAVFVYECPDGDDQLQRGDVMLTHSGGIGYAFPWAWHFTHAGNYDGNNTVYESVGSGVRLQPIAHWQENKRYAFGRNKKVSQSAVVAQLEQAQQRYGTAGKTPYNFVFPNKQTDNKLYCSQLVWKIHQGAGTNVDSNSLKWFTLMALKLSPYYAWNPPLALAKHAVLIASVLRPAVAPDEIYYATDVINFYYDKKK